MNRKIYLMTLIGLSMTACTPNMNLSGPSSSATKQHRIEQPTPEKLERYQQKMMEVASRIPNDPKYNRIALDTPEKKEWFKNLTYRLWDRQITRYDFMSEGLSKYPIHRYEFEFVIRGFNL
ncbi:MAG: hypothetical protein IE885_01780 [Campylobacterales bacterium]|nr:hypothetical protein [Campylobacterales bacterium]